MNIAVLGSGGAGAVFSSILQQNGHEVTLWSSDPAETEAMIRTHVSPWQPELKLPDSMEFTSDPACVEGKNMIVLACPSVAMRETCEKIKPYLDESMTIVSVIKGLEVESHMLMSEVASEVTGFNVAVLSGPIHTIELVRGYPTGCVVASTNTREAKMVQEAFMNEILRVYTTRDIRGVEIGGSLKNVIAICAGVSDGIGFEDNTKALIMTRGISEISTFGVHFGADAGTFSGLSGIGDLINTCTSPHSRNRKLGELIGKGTSVKEALKEIGGTVEGYRAAKAVNYLAERDSLYLPLMTTIYEVLYEDLDPHDAMNKLMTARGRDERGHNTSWFLS